MEAEKGAIKMDGVEILGEQQVIIVNPNPERVYEDTVGGAVYRFGPFKKKSVGAQLATNLLNNARKRLDDSVRQAEAEVSEFETMTQRGGVMAHRAKKRLANPETGKPPRTKPWDFCPLVDLKTPEGMKVFEAGLDFAIKKGFEIKAEVIETSFKKLPFPKERWDKKKLVQFLEKNGGSGSYNEQEERLFTKALALFVSRFKTIQECGFGVIDEETGKVVRPEDLGLEVPAEDLEAAGTE